MTFYNNELSRSILYVTPDGVGYKIGVYSEGHPDGRTETVTGTVNRITESEMKRYIESAESGEVSIESIPQGAIESLRRRLSEENAP